MVPSRDPGCICPSHFPPPFVLVKMDFSIQLLQTDSQSQTAVDVHRAQCHGGKGFLEYNSGLWLMIGGKSG